MIVLDSDDDDSDDESLAPSHQEGAIHATDGGPGGDFGGDPNDVFDHGDNVVGDEHDSVEHVSPRYPRRNRKKKQPLMINFEIRPHNVFVCLKSQDMPVRAFKCAVAWKRMKYRLRLKT